MRTFFAITVDLWTSITNTSFIGITAHFIDDNWELKKFVPTFQSFSEKHTASNISQKINKAIADWRIEVSVMVYDNAANMVAAANFMPTLERIPCAAHTLNLCVRLSLESANDVLVKCRALVGMLNFVCTEFEITVIRTL